MRKISLVTMAVLAASCGPLREKGINAPLHSPVTIEANPGGSGQAFTIVFKPGSSFYYPLMAFWIEDMDGKYIQTLFVARSVGTGVFRYGEKSGREWIEAPKRAPQTLPYWAHRRGVRASDGLFMPEPQNPVPDAYTGATPTTAFILNARADGILPEKYRILMEINQNWDWNQYWHNNRFPGDEYYAMSAQPAVVYEAIIDQADPADVCMMIPVGHSHWSGMTGELFRDLSTLTSALEIVSSVEIRLNK